MCTKEFKEKGPELLEKVKDAWVEYARLYDGGCCDVNRDVMVNAAGDLTGSLEFLMAVHMVIKDKRLTIQNLHEAVEIVRNQLSVELGIPGGFEA